MYKSYDISDREHYYEQFTFPKRISQFLEWKKDVQNSPLFQSGLIFKFRNVEFGASKKTVFEENGKPRYIRLGKKFGNLKHEIAFYKDLMHDHKLISQLHFIDDLFFYGCHTFRYLPREKFQLIKSMLIEKYSPLCPDVHRGGGAVLVDKLNNQIRLVDNVFLNLVYLSGEDKVEKILEKCINESSMGENNNQRRFFMELHNLL